MKTICGRWLRIATNLRRQNVTAQKMLQGATATLVSRTQQMHQSAPKYSQHNIDYNDPGKLHRKISGLDEETALSLVRQMNDEDMKLLDEAIKKHKSLCAKQTYEDQLAALQWRNRFGRHPRMDALGDVDPTGTFCAFPEDWLERKAAEKVTPVKTGDLLKIFIVNAVPFIVFGFLDNFTMIIAGDYIEHVVGTFMCISTLAAAGLGNTISDILGLGSAVYVERGCTLIGLHPPSITPAQFNLKSSKRASNLGRIIGITIGCLLGMTPLLFKESHSDNHDDGEDKKSKPQDAKSSTPTNAKSV